MEEFICAIYASQNAGHQVVSLDAQIEGCMEIAAERGYEVEPRFTLRDFRTGNPDRPALDQVRCIVADGLVDAVVVYSPDHLSLDEYRLIEIIAEFQEAAVDVFFVCGSLDNVPEVLMRFI